ncbi:SDR family NAD(P)-dependent oxidoreductase [Jiangella endophytica]|uniref:SDR family NAD(P)-dependent oxidoreductase n=1 Tax=Jiangella endophytica TaxID=1623398 RepID=UPI000E34B0F2|nr:SDR family NAD(P)-dependent oxidoreductase [Jiangella endophytica]
MTRIQGKVAAVTGAGSGIGRALALGLAARGARVAVSDVDQLGLAGTVELLTSAGADVCSSAVDVSDRAAVADWAEQVAARFGVVHQIYNNAGIGVPMTSVAETSYETYAKVLDINLWGVIHGTKEFLPHVIASGDGHVVNVSSVNGFAAQPSLSAYTTSKFAVRGFTENLRAEMMRDGLPVQVTVVHPAGVATDIANRVRTGPDAAALVTDADGEVDTAMVAQLARESEVYNRDLLKTPVDVAVRAILTAVERGRARVLISEARRLDRLVRLMPSRYVSLMVGFDKRVFERARRSVGTTPPGDEARP